MKKTIALGIVYLLVVMSFNSISGIQIDNQTVKDSGRGSILYVGGDGSGNYTTIQSAIDDAVDGDTVFVLDDSSPYQLSNYLMIRKSINLIGENRDTTVISGKVDLIKSSDYTEHLIIIYHTDWINVSGFTFQNCEFSGIDIEESDNINISGNIFIDAGVVSIAFGESNYSFLYDNIFTSTKAEDLDKRGGVALFDGFFSTIIGNTFTNCLMGIFLVSFTMVLRSSTSNYNIISGNLFDNNTYGMLIWANNTLISRNTISNHSFKYNLYTYPALDLEGCNNIITCNNFINNIRDAKNVKYVFSFQDIFKIGKNNNVWDGNYWGEPRSKPKTIIGHLNYNRGRPKPMFIIPWFNFDMNPAQEPYDIDVTQNYDIGDHLRTIENPLLERFPLLDRLLDLRWWNIVWKK